jgi:hypothetical protein
MATTEAVGRTVAGMLVPCGRWTEVRNSAEGHFLERWAYGSLRSSFAERMRSRVRGYFEHGKSAIYGRQAIMDLTRVWEESSGAWYEADLLDGLPPYLIDGLKRGLYGTSIGAVPSKGRHGHTSGALGTQPQRSRRANPPRGRGFRHLAGLATGLRRHGGLLAAHPRESREGDLALCRFACGPRQAAHSRLLRRRAAGQAARLPGGTHRLLRGGLLRLMLRLIPQRAKQGEDLVVATRTIYNGSSVNVLMPVVATGQVVARTSSQFKNDPMHSRPRRRESGAAGSPRPTRGRHGPHRFCRRAWALGFFPERACIPTTGSARAPALLPRRGAA